MKSFQMIITSFFINVVLNFLAKITSHTKAIYHWIDGVVILGKLYLVPMSVKEI